MVWRIHEQVSVSVECASGHDDLPNHIALVCAEKMAQEREPLRAEEKTQIKRWVPRFLSDLTLGDLGEATCVEAVDLTE